MQPKLPDDGRLRVEHRKRVRHFEDRQDVHELTFSCFQRRPLLTNDLWRNWFCEAIDTACQRHFYHLLAYVLMPEHVHLLVWPARPGPQLHSLLADLKRPFSRRVKQHLVEQRSPLLAELTIRQRPGVTTFRLWQEGPGYDRNLTDARSIIAAIDYIHENPVRRGLCRRAVDWNWSSAARLLADKAGQDPPRLGRFEPELMCVAPMSMDDRKEHC